MTLILLSSPLQGKPYAIRDRSCQAHQPLLPHEVESIHQTPKVLDLRILIRTALFASTTLLLSKAPAFVLDGETSSPIRKAPKKGKQKPTLKRQTSKLDEHISATSLHIRACEMRHLLSIKTRSFFHPLRACRMMNALVTLTNPLGASEIGPQMDDCC